jgi:hypothetical protein
MAWLNTSDYLLLDVVARERTRAPEGPPSSGLVALVIGTLQTFGIIARGRRHVAAVRSLFTRKEDARCRHAPPLRSTDAAFSAAARSWPPAPPPSRRFTRCPRAPRPMYAAAGAGGEAARTTGRSRR